VDKTPRYHNEWVDIIKPSRPVSFHFSTSVVTCSVVRSPHPDAVAWLGKSFLQTSQSLFVDVWDEDSQGD
jgi:hypothetical protein